jgi:hypothetical protein
VLRQPKGNLPRGRNNVLYLKQDFQVEGFAAAGLLQPVLAAGQIPFGLAQHRTSHALSGRGEREPCTSGPTRDRRTDNSDRRKFSLVQVGQLKLQTPGRPWQ